jgi:hypothetical protein
MCRQGTLSMQLFRKNVARIMAVMQCAWCWFQFLIISVHSWSPLVPQRSYSFALSSAPTRRDIFLFKALSKIVAAHWIVQPVVASAVVPTNDLAKLQENRLDDDSEGEVMSDDDESSDEDDIDEDSVDEDSDDEKS